MPGVRPERRRGPFRGTLEQAGDLGLAAGHERHVVCPGTERADDDLIGGRVAGM